MTQKLLPVYASYIHFWRPVLFLFYVVIFAAIVLLLLSFVRPVLALLSLLLWFFNRWTLKTVELMHIDLLALLPLLISLILFERRRHASLLLLGVSLATKQLGIFLVPLYVIWVWNEQAPGKRLRGT